jgi:hypothetical protein
MRCAQAILLVAVVGLGGCGGQSPARTRPPLGRSLAAERQPAGEGPAPTGDPSAMRGGTIGPLQASAENKPAPGAVAQSPQSALGRYALAYTNWQASRLRMHERMLSSLAVGEARLAARQIAASQSGTASLVANHVQNKGAVLAIAAGRGPARGQWVVVTQEQTTGTGSYAGLPSSPHVTSARVTRIGRGWAVSEWRPSS